MEAIILSQKFAHAEQDFEIFVKYDKALQKVVEVKNIQLHTHGAWYPVGNIMDKFFHDAIWKLINETDWVTICKQFSAPGYNRVDPVFEQALKSFTQHIATDGAAVR